ncbi:Uncharacterised protein [Mycobacterium tuberculosis]|nr:Uncharacterised protein [Mycobacterium tuberculosis]
MPRFSTAPPNRPHCTPAFTIRDRSDIASIWIIVIAAPTFPVPPCSLRNPSSAMPAAVSSFICSNTLARAIAVFGV